MSDPNYQRTTRSRNKLNKRVYRPFVPTAGAEMTSDGKRYVIAPDGARVRARKVVER